MGTPRQDEAANLKQVQAIKLADGGAYDGSAQDGESIDRVPGAGQQYLCAKLFIETGSGTASDVVQFTMYESSDDTTFTEVTDVTIPALNDAAEFETVDINLDERERYIRFDLDSADQTVDSTIDVVAVCTLCGAKDKPASDA